MVISKKDIQNSRFARIHRYSIKPPYLPLNTFIDAIIAPKLIDGLLDSIHELNPIISKPLFLSQIDSCDCHTFGHPMSIVGKYRRTGQTVNGWLSLANA